MYLHMHSVVGINCRLCCKVVFMIAQLTIGQKAPEFSVTNVLGKNVNLKRLYPSSILIVFLRYSGCPWCNLALHRLAMEYPLLKKQNCEVIAFIQSTPENVKENIYKRHAKRPPFPIVADQERKIYDLYGVQDSVAALGRSITKIPYWVHAVRKHGYKQTKIDGDFFLVPAMFLVSGRSGKILLESYGSSFYEHETFTLVYEKLGFVD
jgi:peroxiredoxin Q/BCP